MQTIHRHFSLFIVFLVLCFSAQAQTKQPDWTKLQEETMKHFQAILRINSSTATGSEAPVVDYLKSVLDREGISVKVFASDPKQTSGNLQQVPHFPLPCLN